MIAKKKNFELVCVSVVCRKGMGGPANQAMLEASNALSVYGIECSVRSLTDHEWQEVKKMTPVEVLEGDVRNWDGPSAWSQGKEQGDVE